jgi:hypothetical protein
MSDLCGTVAGMVTPKGNMSTEGETLQVSVPPYRCSVCPPLLTYRAPDKRFSHTLDCLGRWPRPACSFRSSQAATLLELHVPLTIVFFFRRWFICGIWFETSVAPSQLTRFLANSKTQNAYLFPVYAMFRHDCPLTVKPANTPRRLVHTKKNLERFSTY